MALLQIKGKENEIILNTPNRKEILKGGPPQNSKCTILGRGSYGIVFKAKFQAKAVAVKIVKTTRDISIQSMLNEANILGWKHLNIIEILKIESTPKFGIVIMERFPGESVERILERIQIPLIHRVFITIDILSALVFCHNKGLLHLDVKPQNVMLAVNKSFSTFRGKKYICKLCDFGSSLTLKDQQRHMLKGTARGTVRYMSPEALRNDCLTPATDIYSLGITMWQLENRITPYDWIECNEIVAYQVVKNNLRPDNAILSHYSEINMNDPCECKQLGSYEIAQLPENSIEYINNILQQQNNNDSSQHDLLTFRKPFQEFNTNLRDSLKQTVVRNLQFENSKEPLMKRSEIIRIIEDDCIDLKSIFSYENNMKCWKEKIAYETIYKTCWHQDILIRPNANILRKRFKKIVYNLTKC